MFFDTVLEAPADPIFGLNYAFAADTRANKVNLAAGVYKTAELKTPLMRSVRNAEKQLAALEGRAEYLPIEGFTPFCQSLGALVFGKKMWEEHRERIAALQSVGGTGALRLAGQFLAQEVSNILALPHFTWPNHPNIFAAIGCKLKNYPYYQSESHTVDFSSLCQFIKNLEKRSVLLLHVVCQNPTGTDLTMAQWEELCELIQEKQIFPFFDFAYHGFGKNLEEDNAPLKLFLKKECEMAVAYSCSKNFSLYNQRVGALFLVAKDPAAKVRVHSQARKLIRSLYSNPPLFGAQLVHQILTDPLLYKEWVEELAEMQGRLEEIRKKFVDALMQRSKRDFRYLLGQRGMFAFLNLDKSQVTCLIEKFGIYMPNNGRIAIVALNDQNLATVTDALTSL